MLIMAIKALLIIIIVIKIAIIYFFHIYEQWQIIKNTKPITRETNRRSIK